MDKSVVAIAGPQESAQALQLLEDDPVCEGLKAYAKQQASYELKLMDMWEKHWLPVQQQAKPILQLVLDDMLPEGLDVGDMTGGTVIIDIDEEINMEHGLEYN